MIFTISDGLLPEEKLTCGHATLATAFAIFNFYEKNTSEIHFKTMNNTDLTVKRNRELYEMEFPAYKLKKSGNYRRNY